MINISQKDFNLDMQSYLSKRRTPVSVKKRKKQEKVEEFQEELKEYKERKSFFNKIIDLVLGEEPGEDEEPVEYEEPIEGKVESKSWFDKIKDWFVSSDDQEMLEEVEEVIHEINEEIKEVLKIQNKWLLRLPKKTIKEFRESKDYELYKETLKKYNLIKN